jgi:hypothetical protein
VAGPAVTSPRVTHHPLVRGGAVGRLASALALATLLLVALGGCQISQEAMKKDPFLQEVAAAQQSSAPHKLGQPFELDNTRWTIQEARAAYSLQLGTTLLQAHGQYIVVRFVLENLTAAPQPPQVDMLVLQTGDNRTFKPDRTATALYTAWMHETDILTATLKPNTPYALALVFDVPRDAKALALAFHSYPDSRLSDPSL